jgi:hypothetical protein
MCIFESSEKKLVGYVTQTWWDLDYLILAQSSDPDAKIALFIYRKSLK